MSKGDSNTVHAQISSLSELAEKVDYSLLENLTPDPESTESGDDYFPRQVFSGHYVPVKPTPISNPEYICHSSSLFEELGFAEQLAESDDFVRLFSGDLTHLPETMRPYGWATGYALSIYGTEYVQQCPFQTGNGYGDGRAISILEGVFNNQRWEMQLKGAGRTPYCRGADGRAVLRSSVREFLAQEHMHALGVGTSRSLSLIVSKSDKVDRPWYVEGSMSTDPEIMVSNPVAISTRVAPSFLRVGQIELFGRRARSDEHPQARKELEVIVRHLISREYSEQIDATLPLTEQIVLLTNVFKHRLVNLVVNWIRVGFCQGNFNSDNCAAGGFTLDYGPFGFCELFDPVFQPWTGGGRHFSFLNQPAAAEKNFNMFCAAMIPLMNKDIDALEKLEDARSSFATEMAAEMEVMWASKLGLKTLNKELLMQLLKLMVQSSADYNMFFRELSNVPEQFTELHKCFYTSPTGELKQQWQVWLQNWREQTNAEEQNKELRQTMKKINPKYTWRERLVVPAYQQAAEGNYELIKELQQVLTLPYEEQSSEVEAKFYRLRPTELLNTGGIAHYSCSS